MPDADPRIDLTQQLIRVSSIGTNFALAIMGMGALGYFIDWWFGTRPVWILIGLGMGFVGGGYRFVHEALAASRGTPGRATGQPRAQKPGSGTPNESPP
jgi:F0F1-type ATP synthase assembly protein I